MRAAFAWGDANDAFDWRKSAWPGSEFIDSNGQYGLKIALAKRACSQATRLAEPLLVV
jgi:hypothetical protein